MNFCRLKDGYVSDEENNDDDDDDDEPDEDEYADDNNLNVKKTPDCVFSLSVQVQSECYQ